MVPVFPRRVVAAGEHPSLPTPVCTVQNRCPTCVSLPAAASLGQTKNELQSYLSRAHVRYTFAGDDFTPDPEAPLIKVSP